MKYTLHGFSQLETIKLGLGIDELTILRWFIDFKDSSKMRERIIDNTVWYYVNYEYVFKELPIMGTNKKTIIRKFDKLVECGIMLKYIDKKEGNKTYFAINKINYTPLVSGSGQNCPEGQDKIVPRVRTKLSRGSGQNCPDIDSSIKDPSIKDKEEEKNSLYYFFKDSYFEKRKECFVISSRQIEYETNSLNELFEMFKEKAGAANGGTYEEFKDFLVDCIALEKPYFKNALKPSFMVRCFQELTNEIKNGSTTTGDYKTFSHEWIMNQPGTNVFALYQRIVTGKDGYVLKSDIPKYNIQIE